MTGVTAGAGALDPSEEITSGFPVAGAPRFESIDDVRQGLAGVQYLADDGIAGVVFLADRLAKPVLVEGPAGTGKTELAKSVARLTGSRLIRLQCYEGLDESKALYEWNYKKQLLRIQADSGQSWQQLEEDIFSEEFLLARPLLEAIRSPEPVVLLVDEVDRVELETEALLLEILSEYQVSIPELGTVRASQIPLVFLTSNNTRELSEALKRRCLYLHIDYPDLERERAIIETRVPGINEALADQVARIVRSIRTLDLKKAPSVSETLDWARTLVVLGVESIDAEQARDTLHILLKYRSDIDRAAKELAGGGVPRTERRDRRRAGPPHRLRGRAAGRRHPGLPDRASRCGGGPAPCSLGGPRGDQVHPRGEPDQDIVALAGLRDRLRDLLLVAGGRVPDRGGCRAEADDRAGRRGGQAGRPGRPAGPGPGRRHRERRGDDARGAGRPAVQGIARRQRRHGGRRGPPGGEPVRRHGGRPAGRRDLLPVPDPPEPRPRWGAGSTAGAGPGHGLLAQRRAPPGRPGPRPP